MDPLVSEITVNRLASVLKNIDLEQMARVVNLLEAVVATAAATTPATTAPTPAAAAIGAATTTGGGGAASWTMDPRLVLARAQTPCVPNTIDPRLAFARAQHGEPKHFIQGNAVNSRGRPYQTPSAPGPRGLLGGSSQTVKKRARDKAKRQLRAAEKERAAMQSSC